jgi:hypothetical protein
MFIPFSDFESHFPPRIVERGFDYFMEEAVTQLANIGNTWTADVEGTEVYRVEVELAKEDQLDNWFCDCPYDQGPVCKHVIALLFAIREQAEYPIEIPPKAPPSSKEKEEVLQQVIKSLDEETMRALLAYFAARYEEVQAHLLTHHSKPDKKDWEKHYKTMIRSLVKSHQGRGGFIDYSSCNRLGNRLFELLQSAKGSEEELAIFYKEIIAQAAGAVLHADDSSGIMGTVIRMAFDRLFSMVENHQNDSELISYLHKAAKKEAKKKVYGGFDWEVGWLELGLKTISSSREARSFLTFLDGLIEKKKKEKYVRYSLGRATVFKYQCLLKWKNEQEAGAFLEENLYMTDIREIALENALEKKEYDRFRALAEDGIRQAVEEQHPGLVTKWKEWLVRLAEETGDQESLRALLEDLYLDRGEMKYYSRLKKSYPPEVFGKKVEAFIQHFKDRAGSRYGEGFNNNIADIFVAEERYSDLMEMLGKFPSLHYLDHYSALLAHRFPEQYLVSYDRCLREEMDRVNNRKAYRNCCRYLNRIVKMGGLERAQQIRKDWIEQHPRRTALHDELKKLKW